MAARSRHRAPTGKGYRWQFLDSALQEKVRNSCGNRAVNKRIYEKSLDGAETISFGGARCGICFYVYFRPFKTFLLIHGDL